MARPEEALDAWLGSDDPLDPDGTLDPELAQLVALGRQLRQLGSRPVDPRVKARVAAQLFTVVHNPAPARGWFGGWLPRGMWRPALALCALAVVVALGGTLRGAVNNSTPGAAFYPLKTAGENAQLATCGTESQCVAVRIAQLNERVRELSTLVASHDATNAAAALASYQTAAGQLAQLIGREHQSGLPGASADAARFQEALAAQRAALQTDQPAVAALPGLSNLVASAIAADTQTGTTVAAMLGGAPPATPSAGPSAGSDLPGPNRLIAFRDDAAGNGSTSSPAHPTHPARKPATQPPTSVPPTPPAQTQPSQPPATATPTPAPGHHSTPVPTKAPPRTTPTPVPSGTPKSHPSPSPSASPVATDTPPPTIWFFPTPAPMPTLAPALQVTVLARGAGLPRQPTLPAPPSGLLTRSGLYGLLSGPWAGSPKR